MDHKGRQFVEFVVFVWTDSVKRSGIESFRRPGFVSLLLAKKKDTSGIDSNAAAIEKPHKQEFYCSVES